MIIINQRTMYSYVALKNYICVILHGFNYIILYDFVQKRIKKLRQIQQYKTKHTDLSKIVL